MSAEATGAAGQFGLNLHATCVAFGTKGIVIVGRSGSGKSSLAVQLIGLGAILVGDDLTRVTLINSVLIAKAPDRMLGVIEAYGVGLLKVPYQKSATVQLLVDLDISEQKRLPDLHQTNLLGAMVDTVYKVNKPYFPSAIKALTVSGRYDG